MPAKAVIFDMGGVLPAAPLRRRHEAELAKASQHVRQSRALSADDEEPLNLT